MVVAAIFYPSTGAKDSQVKHKLAGTPTQQFHQVSSSPQLVVPLRKYEAKWVVCNPQICCASEKAAEAISGGRMYFVSRLCRW